jgi:hypothetical protein
LTRWRFSTERIFPHFSCSRLQHPRVNFHNSSRASGS